MKHQQIFKNRLFLTHLTDLSSLFYLTSWLSLSSSPIFSSGFPGRSNWTSQCTCPCSCSTLQLQKLLEPCPRAFDPSCLAFRTLLPQNMPGRIGWPFNTDFSIKTVLLSNKNCQQRSFGPLTTWPYGCIRSSALLISQCSWV